MCLWVKRLEFKLGFGVQGSGFADRALEFGLWFRIFGAQDERSLVENLYFRVTSLGFRV